MSKFAMPEVEMRPGTTDAMVWLEMTEQSAYHYTDRDLPVGCVVLDVGANVAASAWYWLQIQPAMRVVCFEPDPENVKQFKRNAVALRIADRVELHEKAVTRDGLPVKMVGEGSAAWTEDGGDIESITFDEAFAIAEAVGPVALVKCDAEGGELFFLEAASDVVLERIPLAVVEYHGQLLSVDEMHARFGKLVARLAETHIVDLRGKPSKTGHAYLRRHSYQ